MTIVQVLRRGPARRLARAVSSRSRTRKVALLRANITPGTSVLLLGVSASEGIGTESSVERGLLDHADITCLVHDPHEGGGLWGRPTVRGDARHLPFADRSFDYVVSNAVIEHVGGPACAQRMIAESRRVARVGYLHTTPNRWFPVEPHLMVPLLHWLPEDARRRGFAALGYTGYTRANYWLFSRRTLRQLGACASRCTGRWPTMTLIAHSAPLESGRR